jgi:uncharacterized membrane protein YqjE
VAEARGSTAADFSSTSSRSEPSTSELVTRLTQQSTELIRNELRLAQVEMTEKAKHAGVGAGLFGGAGVVALYGVGALIATIILALATFLAPWLAALIVTVVLFAIAGVVALMGKKQVSQATPAAPQKTIDNVKRDVDTIKEGAHHDSTA